MKFFKIFVLFLVIIVIFGVIFYLVLLNHNDFEKAMVNQAKTQLLITALSEAQSIDKSVDIATVSSAQINALVKHINDLEKVYVLIVNDDLKILSYPYADYVGKNLLTLIKGKISDPDWSKLIAIIQRIKEGKEGSGILDFFSEDPDPKIVKTLIAYAPIRIGKFKCSIMVAMEYNVIANPINRNLRDNLLFMGFVNLMLIIFGSIFYKIHRDKDKLAISEMALNMINKQLHLEIYERKNIDEKRGGNKRRQ